MNKSELRNEKINSVLENKESKEIKWTKLPHDILATTYIPNVREFGKDKTIAKISTNYFGGTGHQEAKLFVNNKKEYLLIAGFNCIIQNITPMPRCLNPKCIVMNYFIITTITESRIKSVWHTMML